MTTAIESTVDSTGNVVLRIPPDVAAHLTLVLRDIEGVWRGGDAVIGDDGAEALLALSASLERSGLRDTPAYATAFVAALVNHGR